jgi:hypothetical protein
MLREPRPQISAARARRRLMKQDLSHRIVSSIERPQAKAGRAGGAGHECVGHLEPVRPRVPGQISACPPPHRGIECDLASRREKGLGHSFLAWPQSRPDLREGHGAAVGWHTCPLDVADCVDDGISTAQCLDDDVGVEKDPGQARRRPSRCVSRRSRLTYPRVPPRSVRSRHSPSIPRSVASRSSDPAPYTLTRASRTSSEMVRPCFRASSRRRR